MMISCLMNPQSLQDGLAMRSGAFLLWKGPGTSELERRDRPGTSAQQSWALGGEVRPTIALHFPE